jgi:AcrR family transcriptional regulator
MTSRGKGRPSVAEAAAIDAAIRTAAVEALTRDGPGGVTMNAIAEASRLSRKTVYARFANKDALFLAVVRDILRESMPIRFRPGGGIEAELTAYAQEALRMIRRPDAVALQRLLTVNAEYLRVLRPDIEAKIDENFAAPLRTCLAAAEAAGEMRVPNRERLIAAIVTLLLSEGSRNGAADETSDADYARFVAALVCHGGLSDGVADAHPDEGSEYRRTT